ncbi:MAG: hypothetical protein HRT89_20375 [Lentisphaeria bacterium]|nr:hypothetical protein [Lentisphaeria bacterium]
MKKLLLPLLLLFSLTSSAITDEEIVAEFEASLVGMAEVDAMAALNTFLGDNPTLACNVAQSFAAAFPALVVQAATALATAEPTEAPEIAAQLAGEVPAQAENISAAIILVVPASEADILTSVAAAIITPPAPPPVGCEPSSPDGG